MLSLTTPHASLATPLASLATPLASLATPRASRRASREDARFARFAQRFARFGLGNASLPKKAHCSRVGCSGAFVAVFACALLQHWLTQCVHQIAGVSPHFGGLEGEFFRLLLRVSFAENRRRRSPSRIICCSALAAVIACALHQHWLAQCVRRIAWCASILGGLEGEFLRLSLCLSFGVNRRRRSSSRTVCYSALAAAAA